MAYCLYTDVIGTDGILLNVGTTAIGTSTVASYITKAENIIDAAQQRREQIAEEARESVKKKAEAEAARMLDEAKQKATWEVAEIITEAKQRAKLIIDQANGKDKAG